MLVQVSMERVLLSSVNITAYIVPMYIRTYGVGEYTYKQECVMRRRQASKQALTTNREVSWLCNLVGLVLLLIATETILSN